MWYNFVKSLKFKFKVIFEVYVLYVLECWFYFLIRIYFESIKDLGFYNIGIVI